MRQMCPYCAKLVDLPADSAGKETPCPACGRSFAVPSAFVPGVTAEKPAPPPGLVEVKAADSASTATAMSPLDHERGLTLNGRLAGWIAPLALTLSLITALGFSYVVSFPGGYRVFAQSPLEALFGSFTGNTIRPLQEFQNQLQNVIRWNSAMLPFLLGLLAVTALAWLNLLYPNPTITTVPGPLGWLVSFHRMRHRVLIGLTAFCLLLMLSQISRGFGLETAIRTAVLQNHGKSIETAKNSVEKLEADVAIGQQIGSFCLEGTLARDVGVLSLMVALACLLLHAWSERRGDRPAPRLVLRY